ncbi:MarR family winged helix-turn-helix transcriptional regulator [Nesterenkonia alba]|uniref:MarR family winged helix-turn-helix transcriptional regulator n=1 Tax=Nesterenkonia alba TaxID=515814 RepID=UPI0003B718A5|nr:MarR family transcriptional regulator [Nesterenkonia alba]
MTDSDRRAKVKELEREFSRLFVRRRFNALKLAQEIDPEIEPASYSVLATLQHRGPMRMTAIARHLGIGKPTLSRQLSTLASRGFVTKKADPADGRALVVSLTDQGRTRLEAAQRDRSERYQQMLTAWNLEEIEVLSELLSKLNKTYADYDAAHGTGWPPHTAGQTDSTQEQDSDDAAAEDETAEDDETADDDVASVAVEPDSKAA